MATDENSATRTRTPWTRRHLTRTGRISTGAIAALVLTLGLFAAHAATRQSTARTLYIALGDSYSAGPGIPTQVDVRSGCERSSHSYPVLVADHLALTASQYRDVSCSSAVIADLTVPQSTGSATDPPQLSALSADATLVTLGIGGNDLDFSGILTRCIERDALGVIVAKVRHTTDDRAPCRASYTSGATGEIQQRIRAVSTQLAATLLRIHNLAPHARVLVVGYPDLFPAADGGACALVLGISSGDVAYLDNTELQLNRVLSSRATAVGDGYVDTYTPSLGHDACTDPSTRWIEPLIPNAPAIAMHPNAVGQQGIADAVERAIASGG